MNKRIIVLFLVLINFTSVVYAHSGRTDRYGGHYDTSTGTYHYHNGKVGEYTKPIELGGELVEEEEYEEEYTHSLVVEDTDAEVKDDEISALENDIQKKKDIIENLQAENKKLKDEKKKQEGNNKFGWIEIIFVLGISIHIAYNIGLYRNTDKRYEKLAKIVMNGLNIKDIDEAIKITEQFYKNQKTN